MWAGRLSHVTVLSGVNALCLHGGLLLFTDGTATELGMLLVQQLTAFQRLVVWLQSLIDQNVTV